MGVGFKSVWCACDLNPIPSFDLHALWVLPPLQVGDLPPRQIPCILQVNGSPLLLSKHRVQRQASDVLQALMQQHGQHPQPVPSLQQQQPEAGSDGCRNGPSQHNSRTACSIDFGVVPAGVEVQRTFYVSNTGVCVCVCGRVSVRVGV